MSGQYDAVIVGGGFYGLRIALYLRESLGYRQVVVLEAGDEAMNRASYVNQARVHNGYHYPRSLLTGRRSRVNLPRFRAEYAEAVVEGYPHYYAIARSLSKTTARQFEVFCRRIGSAVRDAPDALRASFSSTRVERVFEVDEPAFDSRVLRRLLLDRVESVGGIDLRLSTAAESIEGQDFDLRVNTGGESLRARLVIGAAYAGLNSLHAASHLPMLALQHEVTEMALVSLPPALRTSAFTVMDGPFFSMMPFPSRGLHTLSHVRFTPHRRWSDQAGMLRDPYSAVASAKERTQFAGMYADVVRYMPAARAMRHHDSLFEAKTVLARTSSDDSRPILFRADHGIRGYAAVLGGKIDNIYDVFSELERYAR